MKKTLLYLYLIIYPARKISVSHPNTPNDFRRPTSDPLARKCAIRHRWCWPDVNQSDLLPLGDIQCHGFSYWNRSSKRVSSCDSYIYIYIFVYYSHPQQDGKVIHHQISRDLLIYLFWGWTYMFSHLTLWGFYHYSHWWHGSELQHLAELKLSLFKPS